MFVRTERHVKYIIQPRPHVTHRLFNLTRLVVWIIALSDLQPYLYDSLNCLSDLQPYLYDSLHCLTYSPV